MKLSPDLEKRLQDQNLSYERQNLSSFACSSQKAIRKEPDHPTHRPPYSRDADKILHSFSYSRFFDKTQVFFWIKSDIFQHRILHVQLVAKIARDIARYLRLNEDLVEAIALGHDIGHVPAGHDGERILNELTIKHNIGHFMHNYESIWFLQEVEMQNLTLPVLDGILSHNGEAHNISLSPLRNKLSWQQLEEEMDQMNKGKLKDPQPKTLEGCLVRYVDTISYISRDVLDAENLHLVKFQDIPQKVQTVLGKSNREIINTLITDIIANSIGKDSIGYTDDVSQALQELYQFNMKNIYTISEKNKYIPVIRQAFGVLWDHYYDDLVHHREDSKIYRDHLKLNLKYLNARKPEINTLAKYVYTKQPPEIIIRDFLAGMTDQYFWMLAKELDPTLEFTPREIY